MNKKIISIIIGFASVTSSAFLHAEDLLAVYQQAKANDPIVLKAQAQYMASKEGIDQARAILLPSLNASASMTHSEGDSISTGDAPYPRAGTIYTAESDNTTYGISLDMQLYHHDSWLRLDNAKKSAHQSDIAY